MQSSVKVWRWLCVMIVTVFLSGFALAQAGPKNAAPVPPEIFSAKTVFIANAGADSELFPSPFRGTPARGYEEFYAAMQKWGRYQLVENPAQADLVMKLRLYAPNGPKEPDKTSGQVISRPMFRLVIYDRASHYPLWTLTDSIQWALFQKGHDKNFDQAIGELIVQLKQLTAQRRGE